MLDLAARGGADLLRDRLAALEQEHRGDAAHAVTPRGIRILVDIELGDRHLLTELGRDFFKRWSDDPACTHPLLAALARDINDYTSDAGRGELAELIPSVIGLTGDDLHIDARIALVCARTALPVAAAGRQQVLAVSVLACERMLAGLDGRPADWLEEQSRHALAEVPHAAEWARRFTSNTTVSDKAFRQRAAPAAVHAAVEGIALACIEQPDEMLRDLLIAAIGECAAWAGRDAGRDTAPEVPDRGPANTAAAR